MASTTWDSIEVLEGFHIQTNWVSTIAFGASFKDASALETDRESIQRIPSGIYSGLGEGWWRRHVSGVGYIP